MHKFSKTTFSSQHFEGVPNVIYENIHFQQCEFVGSGFPCPRPDRRPLIRNIQMTACSQRGCYMSGSIIEDSLIDGFNTHGQVLFLNACVFKHVILRGKIGSSLINNSLGPGFEHRMFEQKQYSDAFHEANIEYYSKTDWAIDISQAEFSDFNIIGIPSNIIRRDPETQIVVTHNTLLLEEWKKLKFKSRYTPGYLQLILDGGHSDYILIAPKRSKNFKEFAEDLKLLKKENIANPD